MTSTSTNANERERTTINPVKISRRRYLILKTAGEGAGSLIDITMAIEAVASTAIEHPEWDMDEEREWAEWERELG